MISGPAGNTDPYGPRNPAADPDTFSDDFKERFKNFQLESDGKSLTERRNLAIKYRIPFHIIRSKDEEGCQCNALHPRSYGFVKIET